MKKRIVASFLISSIIIGFLYFFYFKPRRQEAVFYPMGGIPFSIVVYDRSKYQFRADLKGVKKRVEELEKVFNPNYAASEINRVNQQAGQHQIAISRDLKNVILNAHHWNHKTKGAFDITVTPLIKIWRQAAKQKHLPEEKLLKEARNSIGIEQVNIEKNTIYFKNKWTQLGLGGIAKGNIVDQIKVLLRKRGIKRGVIDAGGDILTFGPGSFRLGIRNPLASSPNIMGAIKLPASAIVTSGNYERYFEINDQKYSHIIDPQTGRPVENSLVSVTVIGEKCLDADALATALMVMDKDRAIDFLKNNRNFSGILVEKDDDYSVWVSAKLVQQIELTDFWVNRLKVF